MALFPADTAERLNKAANDTTLGTMLLGGIDAGAIPVHKMPFANQPTTADTIGIGGDTYEFVTASGAVADDDNIAVAIGGSAALTLTNLVAAINNTAAAAHANITMIDEVTPALGRGTENVVAAIASTTLEIRPADAPGGNVVPNSPSLAFAEAVTHANVVWTAGNVNLNTLGGRAAGRKYALTTLTVTAAMVTAGSWIVEVPFTVGGVLGFVKSSAGVQRASTDAITFATTKVTVALAGGASPAIQATDVVTLVIFE